MRANTPSAPPCVVLLLCRRHVLCALSWAWPVALSLAQTSDLSPSFRCCVVHQVAVPYGRCSSACPCGDGWVGERATSGQSALQSGRARRLANGVACLLRARQQQPAPPQQTVAAITSLPLRTLTPPPPPHTHTPHIHGEERALQGHRETPVRLPLRSYRHMQEQPPGVRGLRGWAQKGWVCGRSGDRWFICKLHLLLPLSKDIHCALLLAGRRAQDHPTCPSPLQSSPSAEPVWWEVRPLGVAAWRSLWAASGVCVWVWECVGVLWWWRGGGGRLWRQVSCG